MILAHWSMEVELNVAHKKKFDLLVKSFKTCGKDHKLSKFTSEKKWGRWTRYNNITPKRESITLYHRPSNIQLTSILLICLFLFVCCWKVGGQQYFLKFQWKPITIIITSIVYRSNLTDRLGWYFILTRVHSKINKAGVSFWCF